MAQLLYQCSLAIASIAVTFRPVSRGELTFLPKESLKSLSAFPAYRNLASLWRACVEVDFFLGLTFSVKALTHGNLFSLWRNLERVSAVHGNHVVHVVTGVFFAFNTNLCVLTTLPVFIIDFRFWLVGHVYLVHAGLRISHLHAEW